MKTRKQEMLKGFEKGIKESLQDHADVFASAIMEIVKVTQEETLEAVFKDIEEIFIKHSKRTVVSISKIRFKVLKKKWGVK